MKRIISLSFLWLFIVLFGIALWRHNSKDSAVDQHIKALDKRYGGVGFPASDNPVEHAQTNLANIGPAAVPALVDLLRKKDSQPKRMMVHALERVPYSRVYSEHYLYAEQVRYRAAEALGMMGPRASSAIPALTEALKDDDQFVAQAAAEALRKIEGEKVFLVRAK